MSLDSGLLELLRSSADHESGLHPKPDKLSFCDNSLLDLKKIGRLMLASGLHSPLKQWVIQMFYYLCSLHPTIINCRAYLWCIITIAEYLAKDNVIMICSYRYTVLTLMISAVTSLTGIEKKINSALHALKRGGAWVN